VPCLSHTPVSAATHVRYISKCAHINENAQWLQGHRGITYLGDSMSGTCRKLLLLGFWGLWRVGTARASNSATGTCGDPNPVDMPYSISWNTLQQTGTDMQCGGEFARWTDGPHVRLSPVYGPNTVPHNTTYECIVSGLRLTHRWSWSFVGYNGVQFVEIK
jgi:hypothetical protein